MPASQNGTNAKYAKKRPASYLYEEIKKLVSRITQTLKRSQSASTHMSSASPNALLSIGVNAPAVDARLQSPSDSSPGLPSRFEYLGNCV